MPGTYAVLGSTGNCGSALIEILLRSPDNKVHAYCRNKAKLMRMMPGACENKQMQIFEGSVSDVDLMVNCLRGTHAVFLCASTNTNVPGFRVGQDSAEAIVEALKKMRDEKTDKQVKLPKLVILSSASIDQHLSRNVPPIAHKILLLAGHHVYEDLKKQEKFLRSHEDWITSIYIKPGGLAVDKQRGHKLDLDNEDTFMSYLDLSAAMIEAADDPDGHYDMKNVGVVNTGGKAGFPIGSVGALLVGVIRYYFPRLHPYLPTPGP